MTSLGRMLTERGGGGEGYWSQKEGKDQKALAWLGGEGRGVFLYIFKGGWLLKQECLGAGCWSQKELTLWGEGERSSILTKEGVHNLIDICCESSERMLRGEDCWSKKNLLWEGKDGQAQGKGVAGAKITHPGRGRMEKLYPDWGRSFHCYQQGNLTCAAPANHRLFCHCLWFPVQLRTLQELVVDWNASCSWQRNCGTDWRSCSLTPRPWLGSLFHSVWQLLKCK